MQLHLLVVMLPVLLLLLLLLLWEQCSCGRLRVLLTKPCWPGVSGVSGHRGALGPGSSCCLSSLP
jgi:hypothetical protein